VLSLLMSCTWIKKFIVNNVSCAEENLHRMINGGDFNSTVSVNKSNSNRISKRKTIVKRGGVFSLFDTFFTNFRGIYVVFIQKESLLLEGM
jgi:hypothetical protein